MLVVFLGLCVVANVECGDYGGGQYGGHVLFHKSPSEVSVVTSKGPVKGQDAGNYTTFFGIPYAMVDESNPFGASLPYPNFMTPFEASDASVTCPQAVFKVSGILQCLRLNIYVPKTKKKKLPVFVWYHGGGFVFGSAGEYDGKYLIQHEIIVVTVNYRLGPYGFLCLNTVDVPGNQGLKDQVTALRWLKCNIAAFGGDPHKITIAGESYGGGGVELHFYSENEKLFDKAIIQSGAAEEEAMFLKPDSKAAYTLAKILNPDVKKHDALSFLATQDPIEVVKAFNASGMLLRVCTECNFRTRGVENFITTNTSYLYAPERVGNTPILIGYNSKETFADFVGQPDTFYKNEAQDMFINKIRDNFKLGRKELKRVAESVRRFYLGNRPISNDTMVELVNFMSDFVINHPEERAVTRFLDQRGIVYKYLFSYLGNSPYKNISGVGAFHTAELQYLFEWAEAGKLTGEENILMRYKMTTMWANFVKYGKPTTHKTKLLPFCWKPSSYESRSYLNIDSNMEMCDNLYYQRMKFWDAFWKVYEKNHILRDGSKIH